MNRKTNITVALSRSLRGAVFVTLIVISVGCNGPITAQMPPSGPPSRQTGGSAGVQTAPQPPSPAASEPFLASPDTVVVVRVNPRGADLPRLMGPEVWGRISAAIPANGDFVSLLLYFDRLSRTSSPSVPSVEFLLLQDLGCGGRLVLDPAATPRDVYTAVHQFAHATRLPIHQDRGPLPDFWISDSPFVNQVPQWTPGITTNRRSDDRGRSIGPQFDRHRPWAEALQSFPESHVSAAMIPSWSQRSAFRDGVYENNLTWGIEGERDVLYITAGLKSPAANRPGYLAVRFHCVTDEAAARTERVVQDVIERITRDRERPSSILRLETWIGQAKTVTRSRDVTTTLELTDEMLPAIQADLGRMFTILGLPNTKVSPLATRQVETQFRTIMIAMQNYYFNEPPRRFPLISPRGSTNSKLSWRVQLLPQLEQRQLYLQFRHDEPWDSPHNLALLNKMPDVFADPTQKLDPGMTTIQAPVGPGMFSDGENATSFGDVTDGTSNTIALALMPAHLAVPWTKPDDWDIREPAGALDQLFAGARPGDERRPWTVVAALDGKAHVVTSDISAQTLRAFLTRAGGEPSPLATIESSPNLPPAGSRPGGWVLFEDLVTKIKRGDPAQAKTNGPPPVSK